MIDWNKYNDIPELDKKKYNEWVVEKLKDNPELINDWMWRLTHLYYIVTKRRGKRLFFPNRAQREFISYLDSYDRFVILKSRQLGFSTFVAIYFLDKILFDSNKDAGFIAHTKESASDIFDKKVMFAINNLPECIRSRINFEGKSATKLKVLKKDGSTNNYNVLVSSRGGTYHFTHISELGKMAKASPLKAEETLTGSMSSIAAGNKLFIESTAEGAMGLFYDTFMKSWNLRSKFYEGSPYASKMCFPLFFNWSYDDDELDTITSTIPVSEMESTDFNWHDFKEDNELSDKAITWYYLKWMELNQDTNKLFQEYPTTAEDAFLASGQCLFSQRKLSELMLNCDSVEFMRYNLIGGELTENKYGGSMYIYKHPEKGRQYTVGADTGQGLDDGDFSTMTVVDNLTQEPVAFFRGREEPYDFSEMVNTVGKYYNNALVAVETNQNGYYVNDRLVKDFNYPNLYMQQQYDSITRSYTKKVGWDTNAKTRQKALNDFKKVFNTTNFWYFKELLKEMMIFVMNKRGKFEAIPGKDNHDDLVMSTAIAYGVIGAKIAQTKTVEEKKPNAMALAFGECTIEEFLQTKFTNT